MCDISVHTIAIPGNAVDHCTVAEVEQFPEDKPPQEPSGTCQQHNHILRQCSTLVLPVQDILLQEREVHLIFPFQFTAV